MNFNNVVATRTNKTIYRDGDKCIKLFGEDYSKADVLNEALNQARVEATGLKINKIHEVSMIEGKWAIISDYIEGTPLSELMKNNPEKFDEYLDFFIDLQMEVHSYTCPLLTKLKDKINRKIGQTDLDSETRYDLKSRLANMPTHTKLCHGDFTPSNVIIAEDGTAYIIDWAHATQGNASADAALTYLLFYVKGDTEEAEKYLSLYCRKSNTSKRYIFKWVPIVAAAQSQSVPKPEKKMLISIAKEIKRK